MPFFGQAPPVGVKERDIYCSLDDERRKIMYTLEQIFEALGKVENGGTMVADLQDDFARAIARGVTDYEQSL